MRILYDNYFPCPSFLLTILPWLVCVCVYLVRGVANAAKATAEDDYSREKRLRIKAKDLPSTGIFNELFF